VWILFPKEDEFLEKWRGLANEFLVDKLPFLYNNEFDILKKDVHFLEKELDSYRNKLISNRKLITKLEKENFSLEGLILEEEDSLREMIKKWSDKMKKWEKLRAVP
jgi:predicted  nucleic acid-binding Zn-ribbon protein